MSASDFNRLLKPHAIERIDQELREDVRWMDLSKTHRKVLKTADSQSGYKMPDVLKIDQYGRRVRRKYVPTYHVRLISYGLVYLDEHCDGGPRLFTTPKGYRLLALDFQIGRSALRPIIRELEL